MILGLENHGKHATGKHLKSIVELIDSKRVVVNYDTANAIFYGDVDLAEDLKTAVKKIGHLHLKDKAGAQDEWDFPAIGKGNLDFKEIFEILEAHNNDSPLSIEIEFTEAGAADLDEVNQAVKDSYNYLKKLGIDF